MHKIIAELRAKGVSRETVAAVEQLLEAQAARKQAERERSRKHYAKVSREKKTSRENVQTPAKSTHVSRETPPLLLPLLSPVNRSVDQEGRSEIGALAREFATFWAATPHKVGKRDAEKCFGRARRRASFDVIMAGLARYAAKTDDRPWCNPSTWLNQDRWEDQPGPSQEDNRGRQGRRPDPKEDPRSIRGAIDRLRARLEGPDETGELPRELNLRIVSGRSGERP